MGGRSHDLFFSSNSLSVSVSVSGTGKTGKKYGEGRVGAWSEAEEFLNDSNRIQFFSSVVIV